MDFFVPKYRYNPNEKVQSLYSGVAHGGRTVTRLLKPSLDRNSLEATRTYGPGLERGEGGRIGILVIGGMETTLAEVEYLLEAKRQKPFQPKRTGSQIAEMCRMLIERRNERVRYFKKNPSERPKKRARLYLPTGYHYMPTPEPGLKVLTRG